MGALAGVIDATIYIGVALAGTALKQQLEGGGIQLVNRLIGALLIASGVWFFNQEISNFL